MRQDILSERRPYAQLMLDHMPTRVALYDAHDLRLLDANALYIETLRKFILPGLKDESPLGHQLTDWELAEQGRSLVAFLQYGIELGEAAQGTATPFVMPDGKMTYWNWMLDPIAGPDGKLQYLLQTGIEVTELVQARQSAEQRQESLNRTNQELQAEKRRLEVVEIIARSIDESQGRTEESQGKEPPDIEKVSKIAVDVIYTHLSPSIVYLHVADPEQKVFRLLSLRSLSPEHGVFTQNIPYEGWRLHERQFALSNHAPFIISDLPAALAQGEISRDLFLAAGEKSGQSCIGIPLWSGDYLEGWLHVLFDRPIASGSVEMLALGDCGKHIALALATARRHLAVKRERAWLNELLRQLPESIMIVEVTNGRINYANPAASELLGTPEINLTGLILHEHPAALLASASSRNGLSIEPWNFAVVRALGGIVLRNAETQVVQPDGNTVITQMSSAPLWLAEGVAREVAIVMQDVTAQKILERQKNEFLSMVNHELRTPLTVIQGFAEILPHIIQQGQRMDSLVQTAVSNIVEQSEHLVRLIEEMLDISRIEHEQFILQRGQHNLQGLVSDVIRSQGVTTKRHRLKPVLEGIRHGERLMGTFDEKRIKQVLHNLIGNAIKYSPAGGEITVGLRYLPHTSQEVLIWVKDEGIGIAREDLPHIFKRFHRVNTHDRSLSGLGIGLYLVKEIVTRHGGHVWVESHEAVGSTFFLTLPLRATIVLSE
jgi:signal transduction histidine kinase